MVTVRNVFLALYQFVTPNQYLQDNVILAWIFDPQQHSATIYRSHSDQMTRINTDGILDGTSLLPGFELPLVQVFPDL